MSEYQCVMRPVRQKLRTTTATIKIPIPMKAIEQLPVRQFKIYPEHKSLYTEVIIWKTVKDLRRAVHPMVGGPKNFEGIHIGMDGYHCKKGRKPRRSGLCGQIHLSVDKFRMGIITHECGHAALCWARRVKIDPRHLDGSGKSSEQEERFCYALGEMARQIVSKCDDLF